jgi:hypothetical protein
VTHSRITNVQEAAYFMGKFNAVTTACPNNAPKQWAFDERGNDSMNGAACA